MVAVDVVLTLDIGSSGVRARAYSRDMQVHAEHSIDLVTTVAADGTSTHSLTEIFHAVGACIRALAAKAELHVIALCASGTASSLAVLHAGDDTQVLLWSDTRAATQFSQIAPHLLAAYPRTLCPPDVSYWPAKLRYLQGSGALQPPVTIAGAKDLVFQWLTGHLWVDPMTAAATGLFDSEASKWDAQLLAYLHVDERLLPQLHAATATSPLTASAAAELGLHADVPVVLGGMDGPLTQLGSAGTQQGIASCTIGTSIAYRQGLAARRQDPAAHIWCYPICDDFWVMGGAGSNGGNLLTWLRDRIGLGDSVSQLVDAAFSVVPDASLTFVPYLHGERAPLWRADLRAAFVGLAAHHTSADLACAVVQGIAAAVVELSLAVESVAGAATDVVFTGGFVQDARWLRRMTDALGARTYVPLPAAATSTGIAMLAWAAVLGQSIGEVFTPGREALELPDAQSNARIRATSEEIQRMRTLLWPQA